ncbi:hypothetical protein ACOMHN_064751 [Nucella lapillus]
MMERPHPAKRSPGWSFVFWRRGAWPSVVPVLAVHRIPTTEWNNQGAPGGVEPGPQWCQFWRYTEHQQLKGIIKVLQAAWSLALSGASSGRVASLEA